MRVDVQFKLKENPNYLRYLREHSYWYKFLNRNPEDFKLFTEEVKKVYRQTRADRISKTLDTLEMMEKIFSTLK